MSLPPTSLFNVLSEEESPTSEFLDGLRSGTAASYHIAPAKSRENERQFDSGSFSEKKFETKVIGPGLTPRPPPPTANKVLTVERAGSVIVGLRDGADEDDDENPLFSSIVKQIQLVFD